MNSNFVDFSGGPTLIGIKEKNVPIACNPGISGTLVFWFRIQRDSLEFLFSSKNAESKTNVDKKYKVVPSGNGVSLEILSFNKKTDSGMYACAAMNNNKLIFGDHTIVNGEPGGYFFF